MQTRQVLLQKGVWLVHTKREPSFRRIWMEVMGCDSSGPSHGMLVLPGCGRGEAPFALLMLELALSCLANNNMAIEILGTECWNILTTLKQGLQAAGSAGWPML